MELYFSFDITYWMPRLLAFCIDTPNLKFLAPTIPEIWRGSQNFKSRSRDPFTPVNRGRRWPCIWIPWPRFAYSLYNFHGAMGSLQMIILIAKTFLTWNFLSHVKNWPKTCILGRKWGQYVLVFRTPKKHIHARNDVIWCTDRENRCRGLGVGRRKNQKTSRVTWCAFLHIWGRKGKIVW